MFLGSRVRSVVGSIFGPWGLCVFLDWAVARVVYVCSFFFVDFLSFDGVISVGLLGLCMCNLC